MESSKEKKNKAMMDLLQNQINDLNDDKAQQEEEIRSLLFGTR